MEMPIHWMYLFTLTILLLVERCHLCPWDFGCVCHGGNIYCDGQDYHSVPKFTAVNTTYNMLDMGRNRFKRIRSNAFKNLQVKKIKIRQNTVPLEVHRKALKGLEGVLEILHITRSHVKSLPPALFKLVNNIHIFLHIN